jgi:hypothetical protein
MASTRRAELRWRRMIHCALGCGDVPGQPDNGDWQRHYAAMHLGVRQDERTPEQWEHAAEHLIREAARTGAEFTVADVLAPLGAHPIPGRRQFVNGQITNRLAGDGWIRHAPRDAAQSTKPTSNSSLVRRWVGTDKATGRTAA